MSKWGERAKAAKKASEGRYVKLDDGDSIEFAVHPDHDPARMVSWWREGEKVSPGTPGAKENIKYMLCVYDTNQKVCRLLQLGGSTFENLSKKLDKFGEEMVFNMTRNGLALKTKYEIDRLEKLTPEQKKHMMSVQSFDPLDEEGAAVLPESIAEITQPAPQRAKAAPKAAEPAPEPDADIPF